jgi:hypothetical protein
MEANSGLRLWGIVTMDCEWRMMAEAGGKSSRSGPLPWKTWTPERKTSAQGLETSQPLGTYMYELKSVHIKAAAQEGVFDKQIGLLPRAARSVYRSLCSDH